MGAPPSSDEIARMMADPAVQQSMNAALDNPDFINMLIQSNPTLRNLPNAREMLQSPFMRQMMTNPDMIRMASQMQGGGGLPSFPAPGATDNTPAGAPASGAQPGGAAPGANNAPNPFSPFMFMPPFPGAPGGPGAPATGAQNANQGAPAGAGAGAGAGDGQATANPFLQFLGSDFAPGSAATTMNPVERSLLQDFLRSLGTPPPSAPADTRPPEERYAEQLRQLNDMGFYDFDRNVAALRRSGGSVQGAIEHLLGGS